VVAQATHSWEAIPGLRDTKYRELEKNKRQAQRRQFLETKCIEPAVIAGIGPKRVATLSAYGIHTAWDVSAARVEGVTQLGPVLRDRLVAWRRQIEHSFTYNPSSPLPQEALARVEKELDDMQRQAVEQLRRAVRDLQTASANEPSAAVAVARRLATATRALRQAEADVLAATGKVPA
jgi:DNA-binding helix-hairpin-helix protein with protein kinase domain